MSETGFVWMFPSYILATNYNTTSAGDVLFDSDIRFAAPTVPDEKHVAVFTDAAAAEEYREAMDPRLDMRLVQFRNPEQLIEFLRVASRDYQRIVIDPPPKFDRKVRVAPIPEVIKQLLEASGRQEN